MKTIFLALIFFTIYLISLSAGQAPNDILSSLVQNAQSLGPSAKRIPRVGLTNEQLKQLRENCRKNGANGCREQRPEWKQRRQQTKQSLISTSTNLLGIGGILADQKAETHLQKIQNAKRAVMKALGLDDVEPVENGLWEGDLVLNEQQVDTIAQTASLPLDLPTPTEFLNKQGQRQKRNGMIFDNLPNYKWPNGVVPYFINQSFTDAQQQMIKDGLAAIQAKTCIKFQPVDYPYNAPYIYYRPSTQQGICGLSPLGMQSDVNALDLNFDSSSTDWMRRCIQHETSHSLGVQHTQSRFDRDNFVDLQANNIDPQEFYNFNKVDPNQYSSFGIDYEGKSMMHYTFDSFSINGQATLVPKPVLNLNNNDLGANMQISDLDAQLINRMYNCTPCQDNWDQCGYWASYGYCSTIGQNCPKSCGTC